MVETFTIPKNHAQYNHFKSPHQGSSRVLFTCGSHWLLNRYNESNYTKKREIQGHLVSLIADYFRITCMYYRQALVLVTITFHNKENLCNESSKRSEISIQGRQRGMGHWVMGTNKLVCYSPLCCPMQCHLSFSLNMWSYFPLLSYRLFSLPNHLMHLFKAFSSLLAIWTVSTWLTVTHTLLPLPLCFIFDGWEKHIWQHHVPGQNPALAEALAQKAGGAAAGIHSGTEHYCPLHKMEWPLNFFSIAATQFIPRPTVSQRRNEGRPNSKVPLNASFLFCAIKDTTDRSFAAAHIACHSNILTFRRSFRRTCLWNCSKWYPTAPD